MSQMATDQSEDSHTNAGADSPESSSNLRSSADKNKRARECRHTTLSRVLLKLPNFLHPPLVAAAFEFGVHPFESNPLGAA